MVLVVLSEHLRSSPAQVLTGCDAEFDRAFCEEFAPRASGPPQRAKTVPMTSRDGQQRHHLCIDASPNSQSAFESQPRRVAIDPNMLRGVGAQFDFASKGGCTS